MGAAEVRIRSGGPSPAQRLPQISAHPSERNASWMSARLSYGTRRRRNSLSQAHVRSTTDRHRSSHSRARCDPCPARARYDASGKPRRNSGRIVAACSGSSAAAMPVHVTRRRRPRVRRFSSDALSLADDLTRIAVIPHGDECGMSQVACVSPFHKRNPAHRVHL